VASFLRGRGHEVEALTTAAAAPAAEAYPVRFVSRSLPIGARHAAGVALVAARARAVDVVYATGMLGRASIGSLLARTPLVVKLTADPAYERARRLGLTHASLEQFQRRPGAASLVLRLARDADLRRAAHLITPSSYLRELALGWGVPPERTTVLPNPTPPLPPLPSREELRRRFAIDGPVLAFAGRLTAQKALRVGIEAARSAGVELLIAGEGPERAELERLGHGRFLGPLSRAAVLELFAAADAVLLSSAWENFPHVLVEALALGTPVIATRVGGVSEVVHDGENGLVVEPGDVGALAEAIGRFFSSQPLAARLRAAAVGSVAAYRPERVYGRLEEILVEAAA
jgi:glycosyltransferase involved in cell wall biosynthesis